MKRPEGLTGFIGQPVVTLVLVAAGAFALYQVAVSGAWVLALVVLVALGGVAKANREVTAYRQWKQEWDAMAPSPEAAPREAGGKAGRVALLLIVIGLMALYLAANLDQPGFGFALAWLVGGGVVVLAVALVRRGRSAGAEARASSPSAVAPVTICVQRPLLPVPDLTRAYGALPDHCCKLLGIGQP
ncbi:MAG: hypothetical protein JOZ90_10970 [Alphaproteobacteria bacterium]|nr:hypothetical protein [Alphaproteobacteria bacterium]MBV9371019.1 hypothetical protein [Alphaproteobacteria bacterium]MBV9901607.1 hypothetical protein [Alphaproteobacteria bacterium]